MQIMFDPVVLGLGALAVRWFGLLALVGLAAGIWLSARLAQRAGVPGRVVLDVLSWALPAAILGARLVQVLGRWDYHLTHAADLWRLDVYSLSLWGGLAAGGAIALARLRGNEAVYRRPLLDAAAAGLTLAVVIAAAGAFLEGVGQGVPTDLPWATRYEHPLAAAPDVGAGRHPVQVYQTLACVLAFGVATALARASPRQAPPGARGAVFLALYAGSRVVMSPMMLESSFLFGLQLEQMVAGGCLLASVIAVWRIVRDQRPIRAAPSRVPGPGSLAA